MLATSVDVDSLDAGLALDVAAPIVATIASMALFDDLRRVASSATHRTTPRRTRMSLIAFAGTQKSQKRRSNSPVSRRQRKPIICSALFVSYR